MKDLPKEQRKANGENVKTLQFGWPIGMPLVRKIMADLWDCTS